MPIDIRVTTASGSSTHTVWNDDWNEYYVIPLDGPPIDVEFDEDGGDVQPQLGALELALARGDSARAAAGPARGRHLGLRGPRWRR